MLDEGENNGYDAIFLQVQEFNGCELGVKLGRVCIFHLKRVNLRATKLITSHGPSEIHCRLLISDFSGLERKQQSSKKEGELVPGALHTHLWRRVG